MLLSALHTESSINYDDPEGHLFFTCVPGMLYEAGIDRFHRRLFMCQCVSVCP